jgi:hypothetical protein
MKKKLFTAVQAGVLAFALCTMGCQKQMETPLPKAQRDEIGQHTNFAVLLSGGQADKRYSPKGNIYSITLAVFNDSKTKDATALVSFVETAEGVQVPETPLKAVAIRSAGKNGKNITLQTPTFELGPKAANQQITLKVTLLSREGKLLETNYMDVQLGPDSKRVASYPATFTQRPIVEEVQVAISRKKEEEVKEDFGSLDIGVAIANDREKEVGSVEVTMTITGKKVKQLARKAVLSAKSMSNDLRFFAQQAAIEYVGDIKDASITIEIQCLDINAKPVGTLTVKEVKELADILKEDYGGN